MALRLSDAALDALERSGRAASLQVDRAEPPALGSSTVRVEATEAAQLGRDGSGQTVAILDTGVDRGHSFLRRAGGGTKVVSEACYSADRDCPGDVTASTAAGSGVNCTYATSGCRHGTHVAGIAAGRGAAFSGVAPNADLIAIQVFSKFTGPRDCGAAEDPCALSYPSDQIAGLNRVAALAGSFDIAAVNMSLGSGSSRANCDGDARKAAIDNLRAAGIATVIASGNGYDNQGVGAPACISSAITVGATTTADNVADYSNSSSLVELLAPGSNIASSVPGDLFAVFDGTSMAAPHVTGAWALLKHTSPGISVAAALGHLQDTGRPVTDGDNAVTRPRIRALSGTVRIRDTGFGDGGSFTYPGGGLASNGVGLAPRAGGPAGGDIVLSGIPAGATVKHAFLYWSTLGGPDDDVVFRRTARTGELVGASRDTCRDLNQLGPVRVYRATIPRADVPGNGSYSVRGLGGSDGAEGTGASLVTIYRRDDSIRTGRVHLRHGAMTAVGTELPDGGEGETMAHAFSGLHVPSAPSRRRLHVGVADGQAESAGPQVFPADENPMLFGDQGITQPNAFTGTDGPAWDDLTLRLAPETLPVGATTAANSLTTRYDCLAWAYAALGYQTAP